MNRGFIGTIVLIIVALALAKYFLNFDVFSAAETPQGQSTVGYVKSIIDTVWHYISGPAVFVWSKIIWPILKLAYDNFQNLIHMGQGVELPIVQSPSI
ncbi:hypothetical protein KW796_00745 [Candidatus Parcubacteria bacterium]|nr:hypothetical protein [Candidatus Parcubacteria bacterium]